MDFLKTFFKPHFSIEIYQSAGCIFTDGKQVLGGYQKKGSYISGLGGRRKNGEDYHQTAIRETIEELFEIEPSDTHIEELQKIKYSKKILNEFYVALVYDFNDLITFMQISKKYVVRSPLYVNFPETIVDLLLQRKIRNTSEVQQLYLFWV
jgi:hypothetical protein